MSSRTPSRSQAAEAVDRQLARYRAMRDFAMTAEPRGGVAGRSSKSTNALRFVVQKHAARQLHYDFRLGWQSVPKSWAVAKGPSYFTGDRRLAVEVEDHPMEYGGFEGTIPKGQYGGGSVMVWDFGEWQPLGADQQGASSQRVILRNDTGKRSRAKHNRTPVPVPRFSIQPNPRLAQRAGHYIMTMPSVRLSGLPVNFAAICGIDQARSGL